jgi:hypothetical protein
MPAAKYEPLKKAILAFLRSKGPSTQKELMNGVARTIQTHGAAFEGSVGYWTSKRVTRSSAV